MEQGKIVSRLLMLGALLSAAWIAPAQQKAVLYPSMAPLDQYMMEGGAEIALARNAAPASISNDAEILVLGRHGYETAAKGKNGFVCLVERGWAAGIDDPDFWDPKLRGPMCLNAPGARSRLPITFKRTQLALAGMNKTQIFDGIKSAFEKKELRTPEPGAMCYMLSKEGYLGDSVGHWHPHLMFFVPLNEHMDWGASLLGSPVLGFQDSEEQMTVFVIPVTRWSDGTAAPSYQP